MTSLGAPAIGAQLVGRDGTLAALGQLYDATIGGCAQMVLLAGDAGIGKSRVVEEFGDHARLRGDIVATGVCVPANGGLPYAPLVGLLRHLEPGETLVADVAERFAESIDVRSLGAFAQTIFCESVLKLLTELSRRAPVVLVIEDLQWIDSASSLVIDFLARNLGDSRVLILATYRAEDLGRGDWLSSWLVELSRHPRVSEIELGPLSRVEIASLVSALVDQRPAPALVEAVWTRSQGNPFFAEELAAGGGGPSLPAVLQGVVNARINRLSAPAQRLIRIAATIGLVIDHELLTAVDGSGLEVVDSAVRECIDQKVLVVEGESYRFRQALVQEAVYGELLPGERTRRHRAIATILAADQQSRTVPATGRFGELAAHWWAAHEWAAAVEPSLRAADVAASALAYREAIVHLEHVLLAYDRVPDSIGGYLSRAELLEKAADVAFQAGDSIRAVELARAAIEVEAELDPAARARCYTLLGRNLWGVGDSEAAFAAYRHAAAVIADAPPSPELAGLLAEEARGHLLMSLNSRGEQLARQAVEVARAVGARRFEGHALNTLSCCRSGLGYYDEAVELMHEALVIAEEVSNPDDLNRAYGNLSALLLDHGLLDEAASIMFDGAAVGEDLWGVRLNGASGNGVEALVRLGRYAEAQDVLAQLGAHALGICAQSPWTLPAPIMIRTGRFAAAEDTLAIAWQMSSELQDVQQAGGILALGAELELERGRPTVADERLVQALALVARSEDETLLPELSMWIARAAADLHEQVRAPASAIESVARRQRVDDVIARVEEIVRVRAARAVSATPRTLAALAQAVAERSRLDQSDPDLWYRAAQLWVDAHETYPQAYCRWREAEALLEGRIGRARAIDGLNHAWLLARELDAAPLADRITQLAQRARLELFDPASADPASAGPAGDASAGAELGLTRREVEVLGQLAGGRSDRDIAEALFISRKTVGVHVSNVLRKLAVTNRIEAGKVGQAHGLPAAPARR